jgi:ATP-dependent DNA helicase UvrD/PcrA
MIQKTPQQEAILTHLRDNDSSLGVDAKAGTGKTTTGIMICEALDGSAFFGAFNKAIAEELKLRLRGIENSMIEAGTWHSLGFRGWRRVYPKVAVDGDKLWKLIDKLPGSVKETSGGAVRELVSLAKQGLFQGDEDSEAWQDIIDYHSIECQHRETAIIEAAQRVFKDSRDECPKAIDFDDMLWAPLHFDIELPTYETILIDEAQDTNKARRELATKCMGEGGRLVYLGDEHQSIYGFSGADAQAMNLIRKKVDATLLPLTVSWRCSKEVIKRAKLWVPDIEHAPNARDGAILYAKEGEVYTCLANKIESQRSPRAGDAVLCRNTKPLVAMAYHCIRNRVGVTIEGRDIGKRLIKLVEKFKEASLTRLIDRIEQYSKEEQERLIQKGKPGIAASLADMCETIAFLADSLKAEGKKDTRDLVALLGSMFSDSVAGNGSTILLSTIHKAKGREWEKVFILGEDRFQPSKYAKQEWMQQQERNLMYVATTRAKETLVHIQV